MIGAVLARAAAVLNAHIRESTPATRLVAELDGRAFGVDVEGLSLSAVLRAENGRLTIVAGDAGRPPDATVTGPPLALLGLVGRGSAQRLRASGATLTGEIHVAEKFAELMRLAMPDAEEELARWIGDVAAHEIGRSVRRGFRWAARAGDALRLDVAEYLKEESRAVPTPYEVEAFFADVERLRDDVERAAQRLELLRRRAASGRLA